ncbi:PhnE/PtxC family ABC transporter permease [Sagittula sp. S175]|uniref:PhnE/PtxC family ABC transporter permease n=1 Tax=Sagittula sp. S175 TaxID=3415129 RepID=UPI003C79A5D1
MRPERRLGRGGFVALMALAGLFALVFADLEVASHDPWDVLARMGAGLLRPDFSAVADLGWALAWTVAFALVGVAVGALAGLLAAPFYGVRALRWLLIGLRSVHEVFWALLLMQVTGISPLTGVLAIALPYAGTFAKVFAELIEEADKRPLLALPPVDPLSRFLFARAPLVAREAWSYVLYRVECGLRSSAVLGFIGLPTLGFQLDAFFRVGDYGGVAAVLILYVALVASLRVWLRLALVPVWLVAALAALSVIAVPPMGSGALWRFLSQDIVPAPLRRGEGLAGLWEWLAALLSGQVWPGLWTTLVVGQLALVLTGVLVFFTFGLGIRRVSGWAVWPARGAMIVARTIPEYMLAYLFLQVLGPSMLPVVLALAIHNGAIIAHLMAREAEGLGLRADAPSGLTLWGWELVPRLFGRFVALCLYRWEMILRETAIMGLLGVATLGFYLDSALEALRMDVAMVLVLFTALMTACVDALSRSVRARFGAGALRVGQAVGCVPEDRDAVVGQPRSV